MIKEGQYARLLDKLIIHSLTLSEHSEFRKLEKELGMDKTETQFITPLNPYIRKEPVFNPIKESIRQLVREFIYGDN